MFVHHDNFEDARADERRLVCYDCGVACDLTQMREERITFLTELGAEKRRLPLHPDQAAPVADEAAEPAPVPSAPSRGRGGFLYRFRYEKTGATALLGHLDVIRGFHPKPDMSFGPALSLGVASLDEYADIRLAEDFDPDALAALVDRMTRASPAGLAFRGAVKIPPGAPGITKAVGGARYVIALPRDILSDEALAGRCAAVMQAESLPFRRQIDGIGKTIDVRSYLLRAEVAGEDGLAALRRAGLVGDLVAIDVDCAVRASGGVKAAEVAAVIAGDGVTAPPHRAVRVELFGMDDAGRFSPLETGRGLRAKDAPPPLQDAPPA
jgi:radical SAM-linked protein